MQVTPQKLALMNASVDAWCQIACPRLSIDWGEAFTVSALHRTRPTRRQHGCTWLEALLMAVIWSARSHIAACACFWTAMLDPILLSIPR